MTVEGIGETYLWRSVIFEAQLEAKNGIGHQRYMARRWLTTHSRSFMTVCAYAGLNKMESEILLEKGRKTWILS